MAKSVECKCTYNFTCRYCCENAKPYHFTTSTGSSGSSLTGTDR